MAKELEKKVANHILKSKIASGAAGKVMVTAGATVLATSFLAALIPFVGVTGVAIALIALGVFIWE